MARYTGGCRCSDIRYEVTADPWAPDSVTAGTASTLSAAVPQTPWWFPKAPCTSAGANRGATSPLPPEAIAPFESFARAAARHYWANGSAHLALSRCMPGASTILACSIRRPRVGSAPPNLGLTSIPGCRRSVKMLVTRPAQPPRPPPGRRAGTRFLPCPPWPRAP